jgi:hypothetical protein
MREFHAGYGHYRIINDNQRDNAGYKPSIYMDNGDIHG